MNSVNFVFASCWVFIAVLLIIQPWLTRKNVLFGVVFGSEDIWSDKTAKKIRRRYLQIMISGTVIVSALTVLCFIFAQPSESDGVIAFFAGILAMFILETGAIIHGHARARLFKIARGQDANLMQGKIIVETSSSDKQTVISAAWFLLFLPVLLAAVGVALYGYFTVPAEGYHMLFPALVETCVVLLLFVSCLFTRRAPASVRGNPDAAPENYRFRKYMIILLILIGVLLEISLLFTEIGLLIPISPWLYYIPVMLSVLMTAVIFVIYFRFVRIKQPKGQILDDDAKWVLGMLYYNPSDPSCFVEKRFGIGYTLNFARPAAWIFIIGIIAFLIIVTVISSQAK